MQKNRKRSEASSGYETRTRRSGTPLPDVISIDELGVMLDEDLLARGRALEEARAKAFEERVDSRPWEEEIAYVRREQQIRRARRETHSEYVRKAEDEFARVEATLPAGDFDNTEFVYAATGGRPRYN